MALEDDGLFVLAAYFNGIAHPPGYPLWTLLAHAAAQLPLGSVAWRVHALSGLFGALACVALWRVALRLGLLPAAAAITAAAYGVSRVFWSQSIVAEVYTLNALIVFLLAGLALRWRDARAGHASHALWFGVVYGLGLANHWPLLVLATPAIALLLWPVAGRLMRASPAMLPGVLVGLLPYAWMVLRSQQDPAVSYYGPIESWSDLWYFVSRAGYADADASETAGAVDRMRFLAFLGEELALQFGPLGIPAMLLGLALRKRAGPARPLSTDLAILLGIFGPTVVLVMLLGFDFDALHAATFRVYPLTAYGFAALWLGYGLDALLRRSPWPRTAWLMPAALGSLVVALPALLGAGHNVRTRYDWAQRYAATVLSVPEAHAVLFADGDTATGPVGYLHLVEGSRPDIELRSRWGLVLRDRLFRGDRTSLAEQHRLLSDFIAGTTRPVYYVTEIAHPFAVEALGLLRKVDRAQPAGLERVGYAREVFRYFDWLLAQPVPSDPWTRFHRAVLLADISRYLLRLDPEQQAPDVRAWRDHALAVARGTLQGNLAQARALLARADDAAAMRVLAMMDQADQQVGEAIFKHERAEPHLIRGLLFERSGKTAAARAAYQRAWEEWPSGRVRAALERLDTPAGATR